jgi:DNA-binding MarR family transcriptional regulator/N-acetylglutamate synthase-like GNAT family acetyltransferase
MHAAPATAIAALRSFNRFYTRRVGLMEESFLGSGLTLVESRLLFELAHGARHPQDVVKRLAMDAGYVSRLLKDLLRRGLVSRRRNAADGRSWIIALTAKGKASFAKLDKMAEAAAAEILGELAPAHAGQIAASMKMIEAALGGEARAIRLRGLEAGDIGLITQRQGLLYHQEYGWDNSYEALVAKILCEFRMTFDARREACWIAESDGVVVGSVFLVRETDDTARLRLLYVEPWMRGSRLGRRLVKQCTEFARGAGYASIVLWTQSNLIAARKIYETEGYSLVKSEPHRSFGHDLVGETWRLEL